MKFNITNTLITVGVIYLLVQYRRGQAIANAGITTPAEKARQEQVAGGWWMHAGEWAK